MTGLFARLRAWLGGGSGSDDEDDSVQSTGRPDSRVAHRDDRPLETPESVERPEPSQSGDGEPDATPSAAATDEPTVSIPDAEATAGASEADGAVATTDWNTANGGRSERTEAAAEDEPRTDADPADAPADGTVACSVCGTTVDDPSEPCPLCRSTDVGPVADADGADAADADADAEAEAFTRGGRTAVSTADDEAVDRLRDVRKGE
jgi:hypothetical protein